MCGGNAGPLVLAAGRYNSSDGWEAGKCGVVYGVLAYAAACAAAAAGCCCRLVFTSQVSQTQVAAVWRGRAQHISQQRFQQQRHAWIKVGARQGSATECKIRSAARDRQYACVRSCVLAILSVCLQQRLLDALLCSSG